MTTTTNRDPSFTQLLIDVAELMSELEARAEETKADAQRAQDILGKLLEDQRAP